MQSLFGIQLPQAAQYLLAFAIVIGLVALFGLLLRKLTGGRLRMSGANAPRARQPRLGIVDIYDLDRQRQLVLLRRDNIEHLLMIGGPNDVVVETNIVRVAARAQAPSADPERAMLPVPGMEGEAEMLDAPEPRLPAPPRRAPEPRQPELPQPESRQAESRQAESRQAEPRQPDPRHAPVPETVRTLAPLPLPPAPAAPAPTPVVPVSAPPVRSQPLAPPPPVSPPPLVERAVAAPNPAPVQPVMPPPPPRPVAPPVREPSPVSQPVPPVTTAVVEPAKLNPLDEMALRMEEALKAPFARTTPDIATPASAVMGPPPLSSARVEPAATPAASLAPSPRSNMPVDGAVAAVAAALAMPPSTSAATSPASPREEVRAPQRDVMRTNEDTTPPLDLLPSKREDAEASNVDQTISMDRAPLRLDPVEDVRPPRRDEPEAPVTPGQLDPAQLETKTDDPFSIEAIEAEFARLLGRPAPKD